MVNRLQRDQIVIAALNAVDSPSLDQKERPSGSLTGTLGVDWLQRALDFFYKAFPIKGVLTSASVTLNAETLTLPSDYIQDYLNGLLLANDEGRLTRRSLSYLLSKSRNTTGKPTIYAVLDDTRFMLRDIPDKRTRPRCTTTSCQPPWAPRTSLPSRTTRSSWTSWRSATRSGS